MGYKQSRERYRRLRRTYEKTKNSYGSGVYYDDEKGMYRKYTCNKKSIRQQCHRKVRRYYKRHIGEYGGKGNIDRRLCEYWWEVL